MGFIGILLLVFFVISAILLIIVVLIQDDQGDGIGGMFGGGSGTAFGSRAGNVITRFTSILAAIFIISTIGLAWVNRTPDKGDVAGAARREAVTEDEKSNWWDTNDKSQK